jgi:hypothetical protein
MTINNLGNTHIREILHTYIANIQQTGVIPVPFVLLVWPAWLGKHEFAISLAKTLTGEWYRQDCLSLIDCSRIIEKPHTIKISADEDITMPDGTVYSDIGIREVNQRLVKSPWYKRKVLVIEDMERMTESAANGLLKMLEEPLPWRVILWTCSNQHNILPTILSRALIFSFYPTDDTTVREYITNTAQFQWYNVDWLLALASGRPGMLQELLETPEHIDILQQGYLALQEKNMPATQVYKTLSWLAKPGLESLFLQAYMYVCASQYKNDVLMITQKAYYYTTFAINTEHILFDFVMAHYAATHK